MALYLPYPSFAHSVAVLDRHRLGLARQQGYYALVGLRLMRGRADDWWARQPWIARWCGYETALAVYTTMAQREYLARGERAGAIAPYRDDWTRSPGYDDDALLDDPRSAPVPPWLGDAALHARHRAALLHLLPEHYGQLGWTEQPAVPSATDL